MVRKVLLKVVVPLALLVGLALLVLPVRADPPYDPRYDVNCDNRIDVVDIMQVAAHWREDGTWYCFCNGGGITCSDCDSRFVNDNAGEVGDADVPIGGLSPNRISGTAWTSTNDGAGSGLDADMLDGKQASDFLNTSNDYGRYNVASDLYEGTTKLSDKYASIFHNHDDRYYAKSESDNRFVNTTGDIMFNNSSSTILEVMNIGSGHGVYGYSVEGHGVDGHSVNSYGVYASSYSGIALKARTETAAPAIVGENTASGDGVRGTSSSGTAVRGLSDSGFGVYASSNSSYALFVNGTSYYIGYATFAGGKSGYVVDICQNDDSEPLEIGDVVVVSGSAQPVIGDIPVMKVRRATASYSTGVVGIVDKRYTTKMMAQKFPTSGGETQEKSIQVGNYIEKSIGPGEYLTVVTFGAFKAVKVDASYAPIQVGDLLTTSDTPGYAMKAADPKVGTIIGKALAPLESGQGVIPVFITLQ